MMLSRQPMTSAMVQVPLRISSSALLVQTSVPWDRPEIWISSEKFLGRASTSIPRTKFVPISGMPKVPVWLSICSGVTPSASGLVSRLYTLGSFMGMESIGMPVYSSKYL